MFVNFLGSAKWLMDSLVKNSVLSRVLEQKLNTIESADISDVNLGDKHL